MRLQGHKYAIGSNSDDDDEDMEEEAQNEPDNLESLSMHVFLPKPRFLTRDEAIDWVQRVLERSRGTELPGSVNCVLISQLFREQPEPWQQIASEQITTIAKKCKEFVYTVLQHTASPEFQGRLAGISVDAALEDTLDKCRNELSKVIGDKLRDPMTYNHYYAMTIQKMRQRKHQSIGRKAMIDSATQLQDCDGNDVHHLDPVQIKRSFDDALEKNMDKFSLQQALDNQRAYLESRKVIFEYGMDTFREAMGGLGH